MHEHQLVLGPSQQLPNLNQRFEGESTNRSVPKSRWSVSEMPPRARSTPAEPRRLAKTWLRQKIAGNRTPTPESHATSPRCALSPIRVRFPAPPPIKSLVFGSDSRSDQPVRRWATSFGRWRTTHPLSGSPAATRSRLLEPNASLGFHSQVRTAVVSTTQNPGLRIAPASGSHS
jgi:hypothetical protein